VRRIRAFGEILLSLSSGHSFGATYRSGHIVMDEPQSWPDGLRVQIKPVYPLCEEAPDGHVIIVGFGLAGRCVADLLDQAGLSYVVVEKNQVTVETQRALGRSVVGGEASDITMLVQAGLDTASILALTIPDEEAVCEAIAVARRLRPDIYIIARTNYASQGMRASQLGADDVIKAEQAVAFQFYDRLSARLGRVSEKRHRPLPTPAAQPS